MPEVWQQKLSDNRLFAHDSADIVPRERDEAILMTVIKSPALAEIFLGMYSMLMPADFP